MRRYGTRLPQKDGGHTSCTATRPHSTIFFGPVFPRGGGPFSSWPTWRCPPGVNALEKKLGRALPVEQTLDDVLQVDRMICRATRFPHGEYQCYTRPGGSRI